jgi:PAS domain S-box-containing protein
MRPEPDYEHPRRSATLLANGATWKPDEADFDGAGPAPTLERMDPAATRISPPTGIEAWPLLEDAPLGVHLHDREGVVRWANHAWLELVGRAAEAVVGRHFTAVYAEPRVGDALQRRLLAGETVSGLEVELRRPDGSRRFALISGDAQLGPAAPGWARCLALDNSRRHELEQRRAAIVDTALDCIVTMDQAGRILEFNPAAEQVFGWAREEVEGRLLAEVMIPPALREAHWRGLTRFLRNHEGPILGKRLELSAMRRDGSEFPVELSVVPIRCGGHYHFIGHLRDITVRVGTQRSLAESAERLRWLIENTSDAVWRIELEQPCPIDLPEDEQLERFYRHGWLADANESMARIYGFPSAGSMIGLRLGQVLLRDDPRNVEFLRAFVRAGYRLVDAESIDIGADGAPRWMLNSLVGEVRDGLGRRAWGTSRDITARKLAELALRDSEERQRLAIEAADIGIWDISPGSGAARLSERAREILELPVDPPDGHAFLRRSAHRDHRPRVENALQHALDPVEGGDFACEYRLAREGDPRWVAARGKAFFDPNGRLSRFAGTVLDVSARKAIQEALQEKSHELEHANVELERSNVELEQFAYIASHDLQEPLRMVVNFLSLLQRRHGAALEGSAASYVQEAMDGARRMQALIRGLLEYSRAGTEIRLSPLAADDALDDALANLSARIEGTTADIRRGTLPRVLADRVLLAQVFQNLVANALTFTRGTPLVEISAQPRGREWALSVRDHGIGIDPDHHASLFQLFRRLHTRDQYPGTGIGLATVKKIVERHGGRIGIESQLGEGTTFTFTMPAAE